MAEVAPYLVRLEPGSKFAEWVLREGWGSHWGIFATGRGTLHLMRGHFRSLINVYDPDGQPLMFRYYDPRVLRVYLPTCNAEETREFFGPVTSYVLEDEDGAALLRFTCRDGTPHREEIPLGAKRA
jgi:hypothetical protein